MGFRINRDRKDVPATNAEKGGNKRKVNNSKVFRKPCDNAKCSGGTIVVTIQRNGKDVKINDTCKRCKGTGTI